MSFLGKSFLDVADLDSSAIRGLFEVARKVKNQAALPPRGTTASLVFLEPSTRTSTSFEMACLWLGLRVLKINSSASSLVKGETLLDTTLNLEALGVDIIVVRHGGSETLAKISKELRVPLINAGEGSHSHPTQALLDAFTISEERGKISQERVLIVGDVAHSRVAQSNVLLLGLLGAELGICAPDEFRGHFGHRPEFKMFSHLEEGLEWATVCIVLRMQVERHAESFKSRIDDYIRDYRIDDQRLKHLGKDAILMAPGPVNRDFEITSDAMKDPRSRILTQVKNGVLVRTALMAEILGIEV